MQTGNWICLAAMILAVNLVPQFCRAQGAPSADLNALKTGYEQGLAVIRTNAEKALQDGVPAYVAELKKVEQKFQSAGNLDEVLAVRKEMERFGKEKTIPEDAVVTGSPVLRELQLKWQKAPENIEIDKSKRIVLLSRSHIAALEDLKKKLTVQGKVDEAIAAKDEVDRVRTSAQVTAAEFVLANAGVTLTPDGRNVERPVAPMPVDPLQHLRSSLVLHYSFERSDGRKVADKSGKGNHGQLHGGKLVEDGKVGSAYGSSDNRWYIDAGTGVAATLKGDYTVSMWVNMTDKTSRHQGFFFLNKHSGGKPMYAYFNAGLQRMNWHTHANGKQLVIFDVPANLPLNRWAHLVFRHMGTQWEIWLDEKQLISHEGARQVPQKYNGDFIIGSDDPHYMLSGTVDEVMVFGRALTDGEIKLIDDTQK